MLAKRHFCSTLPCLQQGTMPTTEEFLALRPTKAARMSSPDLRPHKPAGTACDAETPQIGGHRDEQPASNSCSGADTAHAGHGPDSNTHSPEGQADGLMVSLLKGTHTPAAARCAAQIAKPASAREFCCSGVEAVARCPQESTVMLPQQPAQPCLTALQMKCWVRSHAMPSKWACLNSSKPLG